MAVAGQQDKEAPEGLARGRPGGAPGGTGGCGPRARGCEDQPTAGSGKGRPSGLALCSRSHSHPNSFLILEGTPTRGSEIPAVNRGLTDPGEASAPTFLHLRSPCKRD